ncbi:NUDIX hydrolase [Leptospira ognonensis]|uniref:GDP-mannose pyrophosphatase n=1 Tax=Leptospira ognonensis TaxID=2484945 RepID=A0A4R9K1V6_9LEPT|nr:NUDIX hydrolase [Leptospira ognonensis]TGL59712.1 NUDIX hydrolase [Leptospira ognonensis]
MENRERKNWKEHFPTPIYTLSSFEIKLPRADKLRTYFVLKSKDWVNVIPITEDGRILLIKQYRHGIGEISLELPGGIVDEEGQNYEAALISAKRELREETGFTALDNDYEYLNKFSGNPAMFTNWSYSFIARNVKETEPVEFDEGEDIEILFATPQEVKEYLFDGQIHHPHMVAALGLYFLKYPS